MKKIVLIILGCFMMGAMANATSTNAVEESTSSSAIETAMTPPPIDAFNRLIEAGILTQDIVDAVLDLYYNPGDDLAANSAILQLLKALGKVYLWIKVGLEAINDVQAVGNWISDNFEDHGCGTGYPVPSFTGGGLQ